jgi:hypothetical protein
MPGIAYLGALVVPAFWGVAVAPLVVGAMNVLGVPAHKRIGVDLLLLAVGAFLIKAFPVDIGSGTKNTGKLALSVFLITAGIFAFADGGVWRGGKALAALLSPAR